MGVLLQEQSHQQADSADGFWYPALQTLAMVVITAEGSGMVATGAPTFSSNRSINRELPPF